MIFSKNKISLYAVYDFKSPDVFLTLTTNLKEANEYMLRKLITDRKDHFLSWCELRNYDIKDMSKWIEYARICIPNEDKERIVASKVKFSLSNVASILRMFSNCLPLGCSFDQPSELIYFKAKELNDSPDADAQLEEFANRLYQDADGETPNEQ